MLQRRRFCAAAVAAATGAPARAATLQPGDDPSASPIWLKVRASLFANRAIAAPPADLLVLEAPSRAIDAAVVPIAIRARWPQTAALHVQKLYLIIDANPSPISAIFQFTPESGRADIETRVRVDDYSHMRAIAETSDGQLFMITKFVKASGGCSAPAGGDAAAALAAMGKMRFRVDGDLRGTQPVLAQLTISHPNHSGLAMDQYTRQFTPADYVRKVDVSYRGKAVFAADVDFSMSENPHFRFHFLPSGGVGAGELRATVVDSRERHFEARHSVDAAAP